MSPRRKFNTVLAGLLPGLLLPVVTMFVFWGFIHEGGIREFLSSSQRLGVLSKMVSLAAIPNLLLFFIFIWTDRYFAARGVIFATLLVAGAMLVMKFI
jgi:hypothetical protein